MIRSLFEDFWRDFRLAGRNCRQAAGGAITVILLMALGIAGVLSVFGPLYSLVLSPLPFPKSDQLVWIAGDYQGVDPYSNALVDREALTPVFSAVMAYRSFQATLTGSGPPAVVGGVFVSPGFFRTLGVQPRLCQDLAAAETDINSVVVSDQLWRTRLQGQSDLARSSIVVDHQRLVVAGVMPPGLELPQGVQLWRPAPPGALATQPVLVGRLRPGVSITQAQARIGTLA